MKIIICLLLLALVSSLSAQYPYDELNDLSGSIVHISEDLLAGYAQPLVDAFSVGISTGLFHSAYSHDFLGFDFGMNLMYIDIPSSARYFTGTALICSLATDSMLHLVQYEVELESLSTVFGPRDHTVVPTEGNSLAVPPIVPGGFNFAGLPLFTPQLNIGLIFGSEIAIRYVPFKFGGSRIKFQGIGIKQELTKLPPLSLAHLPFALAIAGLYQKFTVKNSNGQNIINSRTMNLQAILSTRIGPFEPMFAYSIENTTADIKYVFEYEIPDTISGIPLEELTVHQEISAHLKGQYRHRSIIGVTLRTGLLFMHYDYNFTPYSTHNVTLGFTWR
jgi:hypothetical protein